ncbi:hypothetical protein MicloDRAFT_00043820 [Microvirga lotononidis]|uniref:Uncharacterized protein n=1 Tax=Microvirga lotononidis TaxID=864069 RepID=I4YV16_9HYPH|nr:hypothetical protein MicloDRAFT_00043820 [Microvirga lotononidis]
MESGEDAWGFVRDIPAPVEGIVGFGEFVLHHMPMVVFNGLIGGLCVQIGKATLLITRSRWNYRLEALIRMVSAFVVIGVGLVLVLASGLFSLLAGMPFVGWLGFLMIGAGVAIVAAAYFIKSRSVQGVAKRSPPEPPEHHLRLPVIPPLNLLEPFRQRHRGVQRLFHDHEGIGHEPAACGAGA